MERGSETAAEVTAEHDVGGGVRVEKALEEEFGGGDMRWW